MNYESDYSNDPLETPHGDVDGDYLLNGDENEDNGEDILRVQRLRRKNDDGSTLEEDDFDDCLASSNDPDVNTQMNDD